MQVNKTEEEPDFEPYTLEIKVESEEEHLFFHWLQYENIGIPELIKKSYNEFKQHMGYHDIGYSDKESLKKSYGKLQQALNNLLF